jgi:hypothetical protein
MRLRRVVMKLSKDRNNKIEEKNEEQHERHPEGRRVNKDEEKNRDKPGRRFGKRWFPYPK